MIFWLAVLIAVLGPWTPSPSRAAESIKLTCNSYSPLKTLFTDVCWTGIFPITIAGVTFMGSSSGVPDDASRQVICVCGGDLSRGELPKIGFTVGFWAPARIIDVTRKPYCLPSLGGIELPLSQMDLLNTGANLGRGKRDEAFANWVMYAAPLIYMLRLLDEGACPTDGVTDFDVLHMSPLMPTQNDVTGRYTLFLNPEMSLLAAPSTFIAMPIDGIASTAGSPINHFFWVAGTWGNIYPITGFKGTGNMNDPVRMTSLIAVRSVALLHRLGLMRDTVGNDNICRRKTRLILRKDALRWQMLAPSPEGQRRNRSSGGSSVQVRLVDPPTRGGRCTHPTGAATATWGMWRDVPGTGEDHSYMLFQWTDCCFGMTPG